MCQKAGHRTVRENGLGKGVKKFKGKPHCASYLSVLNFPTNLHEQLWLLLLNLLL